MVCRCRPWRRPGRVRRQFHTHRAPALGNLRTRCEHATFSSPYVIRVLINYKSTDMIRKNATSVKSRSPRKTQKGRKSVSAKKPAVSQKRLLQNPGLAGVRPPPPGRGKRGEKGSLAYLLRQAQSATRLTLERALADHGITQTQFAELTMLRDYPGLSGADLARVALLTPQTVGVIIRNLERDRAIRKTPHPVHGRVLQWTLTRHGLNLLG